jgi:hypothetical protein
LLKNRSIKVTALALLLALVAGCAMFQADPVGSSLVAAKNTYEAYIVQAGEAYKSGTITQPQLVEIRNVGNRFYDAYQLAEQAYLVKNEKDYVKQRTAAEAALLQLTNLIQKYVQKRSA